MLAFSHCGSGATAWRQLRTGRRHKHTAIKSLTIRTTNHGSAAHGVQPVSLVAIRHLVTTDRRIHLIYLILRTRPTKIEGGSASTGRVTMSDSRGSGGSGIGCRKARGSRRVGSGVGGGAEWREKGALSQFHCIALPPPPSFAAASLPHYTVGALDANCRSQSDLRPVGSGAQSKPDTTHAGLEERDGGHRTFLRARPVG